MNSPLRRRVALTLLAALLAACSSKGPVREPAELQKIKDPAFKPKVVWDRSPGDGDEELHLRLQLAVEPDLLVTADLDGDVIAVSPEKGKRLWKTDTGARLSAGPTVSGSLVLVGTLDAEVIALKRADGSEAWRAKVSGEVLAPVAGEGRVLVVRCGDGKIYGLLAETGERVWSFDRAVPPLTLRGMSSPLVQGNLVFIGLDSGRAVALKADTGDVVWEQLVSAPEGRTELERIVDVDANLLVLDDGVYAVSFGGDLAAVSLEDGRVAWRRPVKSFSGIALSGKRLIVTDEEGLVWALDAETGAAAWKQEGFKYRRLSPPAVVGGYVAVADLEGYVHFLSPEDGTVVARVHAVDAPVIAPMVAVDKRLYVLDRSGEIAAIAIP